MKTPIKRLLKTPISYYGGKQMMLRHILPLIPNHTLYTEAFCGGAAVMFAKQPAVGEVINDINGELVNFYRVAKSYPDQLITEISKTLHSRDHYDRARTIYRSPNEHTAVDRAWAVWVLTKLAFSSRLNTTFGFDRKGSMARKIRFGKEDFTETLCNRLDCVTIENDDALKVIARYDCEGAFHFVDPPYISTDCGHYAGAFSEENLRELLLLLITVKGKFMLTMFPNGEIEAFATTYGWTIHRIIRTKSASVSADSRKKQEEWIVYNY